MSSLDHVRWLSKPSLKQPVIVTAFTGWNDAADAASNAVRNLIEGWRAQPLAEIDPEEFTDFATIRPHVRLKDGGVRNIVWPTVGLWHVSGAGGDIILVLGPEPSLKWRTFSEQLKNYFGHTSRFSMGNDAADISHDGWPDLLSLDMLAEDEIVLKSSEGDDNIQIQKLRTEKYGYHYQFTRNMMFINQANSRFLETGLLSGIGATDWSWSGLFADYDQDGEQDLFISNGIPKRPNDLDFIKFVYC